jgi:lipid-A-disaccharide synthase
MPGSRKQEVEKIFPESIKAAEVLARDYNLQIVVSASQNISEGFLLKAAKKSNFKVITGHTYNLMKYSKFGIIKSGTSTLEAAIFQLPMIIVYKASGLTYLIGKKLIKLKNIGMANIILNEEVVPELIQNDVSSQNIITKSKEILSNSGLYDNIKLKLGLVKEKLGENGASKKAAQIIFNLMNDFQKN